MPIVQLVPKEILKLNWWKKTLFLGDKLEENGCEYVYNISLEKYFLTTEFSNKDILKVMTEKKLISEAILIEYKNKIEFLITQKEVNINLELKLGEPPFVVKMNCHLSPKPALNSYVPPHMRKKEEISTIDKLIGILPIKDFLSELGIVKNLSKMNHENCDDFGYKVHEKSKEALGEKKKNKVI